MHLMITAADDVTSDLLCERLGDSVLRLNWERWQEYQIFINLDEFIISDRFYRKVTAKTIGNIIWRKPVAHVEPELGEIWYGFEEFKYGVEAIIERIRYRTPEKLPIDPLHNLRINKFYQMEVASRYFEVPEQIFTTAPQYLSSAEKAWVAKSLSGLPVLGTGALPKVLFTCAVQPEQLLSGWPWFLQEAIAYDYDLTIQYVDGQCFAFVLQRNAFAGLDWRTSIGNEQAQSQWQQVDLPPAIRNNVRETMHSFKLRFGRLDLLAVDETCNQVAFLEVNPNGQWAWLDMDQTNGLFDAVVKFLSSPVEASQPFYLSACERSSMTGR